MTENNLFCSYNVKIELPDDVATVKAGRILATVLAEIQEANIKLLLLFGTLGAGKTTFTRGFVSALKNSELAEVASPTFALVNHYPTKPPVIHADMYRLAEMADFTEDSANYPDMPEDLENAIFEEDEHDGYVIIEWAEFLDRAKLPKERLDIFLKINNNIHSLEVIGYTNSCKELFEIFEKRMQY